MESGNGSQEPLPGQDFNSAVSAAQQSGDFDFVLQTAKSSKKMLVDFREAVLMASFHGSQSAAVAMGLNFLDGMIRQAESQLQFLKETAQATREALEACGDSPPGDSSTQTIPVPEAGR
jgi:hypothetical protein